MRHFVCFYSLTTVIYYSLQKEKPYLLLHREFDHILNKQKYFTHNFVSTFHGQKMDMGFNLTLFIFCPQLLRCFSEKEKYKTGILVTRFYRSGRGAAVTFLDLCDMKSLLNVLIILTFLCFCMFIVYEIFLLV